MGESKSIPFPTCATCERQRCYAQNLDCFGTAAAHRELYAGAPARQRLHAVSSGIEAAYYHCETRLGETIHFIRAMGYQRVGIAFCVGLVAEARFIAETLAPHVEVASVCCKLGGIPKADFDIPVVHTERADEGMCNPLGQAERLNAAGTEFNLIVGLCVGHDALFAQASNAPVSTLIAKDRVLGHNPAAAVYCRYVKKRLPDPPTKG